MSIASEIQRLQTIKTNIRSALVDKGVDASTHNFADFALDITQLSKEAFAYIAVTYPSGATCVCSNGTDTFVAKDTLGVAVFGIPYAGIWNVTATNEEGSKTYPVSITAKYQTEYVNVIIIPYIYKSGANPGNLVYASKVNSVNSPYSAFEDSGCIFYSDTTSGGGYGARALAAVTTKEKVNLNGGFKITIVEHSNNKNTDSVWLCASSSPISFYSVDGYPYFGTGAEAKSYRRVSETSNTTYTLSTTLTSAYVTIAIGSYDWREYVRFKDWIAKID